LALVRITGLIGTYTDPNILIAYSDGEVRQEFTLVYAAQIESGELKIDDESKEAAWSICRVSINCLWPIRSGGDWWMWRISDALGIRFFVRWGVNRVYAA